jgi:hypothetical protein
VAYHEAISSNHKVHTMYADLFPEKVIGKVVGQIMFTWTVVLLLCTVQISFLSYEPALHSGCDVPALEMCALCIVCSVSCRNQSVFCHPVNSFGRCFLGGTRKASLFLPFCVRLQGDYVHIL